MSKDEIIEQIKKNSRELYVKYYSSSTEAIKIEINTPRDKDVKLHIQEFDLFKKIKA